MAYQGSFLLGISWLQPVFDAMNAVLNPLVQMDHIFDYISFDSNCSKIIGGSG